MWLGPAIIPMETITIINVIDDGPNYNVALGLVL